MHMKHGFPEAELTTECEFLEWHNPGLDLLHIERNRQGMLHATVLHSDNYDLMFWSSSLMEVTISSTCFFLLGTTKTYKLDIF